jgi:hypothetical protein
VHWATTRQNESLSSPPARPPIAYLATNISKHQQQKQNRVRRKNNSSIMRQV